MTHKAYFCMFLTCASLWAGESGQIKNRALPKLYVNAAKDTTGEPRLAECRKRSKRKIDQQYDLKELFKKLPCAIGLYIASLAEESLNVETEYVQKMVVSGEGFEPIFWVPIITKLVSTKNSTIGERKLDSTASHYYGKFFMRPHKKEVKPHKSVTKTLLIQKFYSEQAAPAPDQLKQNQSIESSLNDK